GAGGRRTGRCGVGCRAGPPPAGRGRPGLWRGPDRRRATRICGSASWTVSPVRVGLPGTGRLLEDTRRGGACPGNSTPLAPALAGAAGWGTRPAAPARAGVCLPALPYPPTMMLDFAPLPETPTMRPRLAALLTLFLFAFSLVSAADDYKLGPDSLEQPGVPKGKITKHTWTSKVFPGTERDYFVYVPAQYDPNRPACVMVFQDGHNYVNVAGQFRVPVVLDNLIHKKELPVIVGIFINP